jgi:hypothetical protein
MLCRTVSVKDRRREKERENFFSQIVVFSVDAPGAGMCVVAERGLLFSAVVFSVCVYVIVEERSS